MIALLLDIANILGGLLLAVPLFRGLPNVGDPIGRFTDKIAPWAWLVGLLALITGGYYLIVHLFSGPHVFHFEVVGIAVGVILLWDRLTGRRALTVGGENPGGQGVLSGRALLLAIFGVIAIIVGLQGLFTPN
ncbi:hypothetical protein FB565_000649 [Actinoplanes lutulentus]|uniref:Uncharacterized protein n=1 Tax=Actinoplanes lutulentus TaxID=1287878 RepID=A0A327ZP89_9ACTN|nr:hypothetical protein [Actinoplanes lutulentus]MBB2940945.1 hypothetical protein [Actinoplanes lutulentus]RAK43254.1 hypothetical protein B0I29_101384 [Actinoplanes lutulentus]